MYSQCGSRHKLRGVRGYPATPLLAAPEDGHAPAAQERCRTEVRDRAEAWFGHLADERVGHGHLDSAIILSRFFGIFPSPLFASTPVTPGHGLFEHVFDLAIDAAEFIGRPALEFGPERRVNPQQECFSFCHSSIANS